MKKILATAVATTIGATLMGVAATKGRTGRKERPEKEEMKKTVLVVIATGVALGVVMAQKRLGATGSWKDLTDIIKQIDASGVCDS